MKKEYECPKAEKMEFDYTEAVVASACKGGAFEKLNEDGYGCITYHTGEYSDPYGTSNMNV